MKPTFRGVLTDSHIAVVAIAVLLVWSIDSGGKALLNLIVLALEISDSVVTAGLMWWHDGIIAFGSREMFFEQTLLVTAMKYLFWTVITFGEAWIVSRCIYGVGPLRTLSTYRGKVTRRDYV